VTGIKGRIVGLRIVDGVVIVDHDSNEHLHTTRNGNPTDVLLGDLTVHSVYKRLKTSAKHARDRSQKVLGDNCPLIYAVKGNDGLSTTLSSTKLLLEHAPHIISDICLRIDCEVDGIVAMPSSFPLANWLARRVSRETGLQIFDDVFRKSSKAEAANRAEGLVGPPIEGLSKYNMKQLKNAVKASRKSAHEAYSAKTVKTGVRHYFDPLQWQGLNCPANHRLLLVDDLLASGSTFDAASSMLIDRGWPSPSHAVTWFSAV